MTPLKAAQLGKTTYRYYVSSLIQAERPQNLGTVTRISVHIVEEIVVSRLHELNLCIQTEASPDWSAIRNLIDRVEVTSDAVTLQFDEAMLEQASRNLGPQDRISIDRL
ncbi:hypothetical protein [Brevundimonas sp.]|uniref:hypothetical protein n=1 Tax=Brevundimonas sp. TaxID=1871086 RepID=UPI0035ADFAFE